MSKHTPESAIRAVSFGSHGYYGASILGPRGVHVAHFSDAGTYGRDGSYSITRTEAEATAKRMAMCYRACEGMPDMKRGSVKMLVTSAKALLEAVNAEQNTIDELNDLHDSLRELGEDP